MHLIYQGPHQAVEVPALRRVVDRGEPVDVDDELATRLLEQEHWTEAPAAPRPAAAARTSKTQTGGEQA